MKLFIMMTIKLTEALPAKDFESLGHSHKFIHRSVPRIRLILN